MAVNDGLKFHFNDSRCTISNFETWRAIYHWNSFENILGTCGNSMQLFFLVAGRRETVFRRELAAESSSLGIFSRDPTTNAAYVTLEELGGTVVASWQPVSMHRCWKDLRARASLAISSRQDVCELYYEFIYTCHDCTRVFPRAENANWKDRECCPIGTLNLFAFEIWIDVLHLLTQIILIYSTLERKIVRNKESNIALLPSTEGSD